MTYANKHEAIYEHLSAIVGFKFKAHLKGTDIEFKDLYRMHNILTGTEEYLVIIDGNRSIRFLDSEEFMTEMIRIVKSIIKDLNSEYKELNRKQESDAIVDEVYIFERHEYIGYTGERLIKFMNAFRDKLKQS